ncbi:MAG: acyl-CoA dehydrogenase family protein [Dehalococcoidia bacterium]
MDFRFNSEEQKLSDWIDDYLRMELPPGWVDEQIIWPGGYGAIVEFEEHDSFRLEFTKKMYKKGLLSAPKEYGGIGSNAMMQAIMYERLSYYRAPTGGTANVISAPTILKFGSEEMKREWIPRIINEGLIFWLGYSEPNSGSDLASMQSRAFEDGDDLIVNGQKIWSSGAHVADYGWMVARTDMSVPAHKGTTLFIMDNHSSGITIRPLINIVGYHSFNEVFLDNVRVPKKNIIGQMNMGFYYLMAALDFERLAISMGGFRREFEDLVKYARENKRNGRPIGEEPSVRQKLAELAIEIELAYMFYFKTAWMVDNGLFPNVEASILKLVSTTLSRKIANVGMEIMGQYGQLSIGSKCAQMNGRVCIGFLDSISAVVGAGTSEIQRNIIAQRGLGLPRK